MTRSQELISGFFSLFSIIQHANLLNNNKLALSFHFIKLDDIHCICRRITFKRKTYRDRV